MIQILAAHSKWMTYQNKLKIDSSAIIVPLKQILNTTCNLGASAVILGCISCSLLKYSDNSFVVTGVYKAIVVGVDKMDLLMKFDIGFIPYISAHMIPGFEFKFLLNFCDSQFINLCSVQT